MEYLLVNNGQRAAIAVGYAPHAARIMAAKFLTKANVKMAVETAMAERAARLRVTGVRIIQKLARMAFADPRDYEEDDLDIKRLDADQAAAISMIDTVELVDAKTGAVRRRTKVRLHDKTAADDLGHANRPAYRGGQHRCCAIGDAEGASCRKRAGPDQLVSCFAGLARHHPANCRHAWAGVTCDTVSFNPQRRIAAMDALAWADISRVRGFRLGGGMKPADRA
jgi:phage terminase small subunit